MTSNLPTKLLSPAPLAGISSRQPASDQAGSDTQQIITATQLPPLTIEASHFNASLPSPTYHPSMFMPYYYMPFNQHFQGQLPHTNMNMHHQQHFQKMFHPGMHHGMPPPMHQMHQMMPHPHHAMMGSAPPQQLMGSHHGLPSPIEESMDSHTPLKKTEAQDYESAEFRKVKHEIRIINIREAGKLVKGRTSALIKHVTNPLPNSATSKPTNVNTLVRNPTKYGQFYRLFD